MRFFQILWSYTLLTFRLVRRPNTVEIQGVILPIGAHLSRQMRKVIYQGKYEKHELNIIKRSLTPDDVVLELGAGLGLVSTYCAKRIGSDRVFAFEANAGLEPILQSTYALNGVSPHLSISMLGKEVGEKVLYIEQDLWSSSTVRRSKSAQKTMVPVQKADEALATINPSFLIVDIEGGEHDLLQHLPLSRVSKVMIEVHERVIGKSEVEAVRGLLGAAGLVVKPEWSTEDHWFLERP
jgi:FkbM family methyltransferase